MKKKRIIALTVLLVMLAGVCSGCSRAVRLTYPENDAEVLLIPTGIKRYLDDMHTNMEETNVTDYSGIGKERRISLTWDGKSDSYDIFLSTNPDMSGAKKYTVNEPSFTPTCLLTNKVYYWHVKTDTSTSDVFCFQTDASTRWITVSGIANVRDMGGYETADGSVIRQGLLYRGTEMNNHYNISNAGKNTMLNELGIKTDLDLRWKNETSFYGTPLLESPLGQQVLYCNYPIAPYDRMLDSVTDNERDPSNPVYTREMMCKIFELLSDESNYPIYIHCFGGADRTGCLCFIINGLLGASYTDLVADYEQTTFTPNVRTRDANYEYTGENYGELFSKFLEMLRTCGEDGDSWQTLCEKYLREIGVSDEQIRSIRNIMLEVQQ